ncbi:MAG: hypothetical protein KKF46_02740 [Nanoarchaeota archaeon]|nr:hypothetical protein [Nanoarchaeota archaeon]MBU1321249.1 hypothetical protein [Nanoarchaeota archaeon]MBU2442238.1 hypothetical protein [Nanoarchaeota archaeon]
MKKLFFPLLLISFVFVIFLLISLSFASAENVYNATGTITLNNDNGQVDIGMSNTLSIIFYSPSDDDNSGSGGGSGYFDRTNYSTPTPAKKVIQNLEELLGTVKASDLGFSLLSIDKMKAEEINNFLRTSQLDASGIRALIGMVQNALAQSELQKIVQGLEDGELESTSVEHETQVFKIDTIYTNLDNHTHRTRVIITVRPDKDITEVRIIEYIPKSIASSASSSLVFTSDNPKILAEDPLLEWNVPLIRKGETKTFQYYVKGEVTSDDFRTFVVNTKPKALTVPTGEVITPESKPDPEPKPKKKLKLPWVWIIIIIIVGGGIYGALVYMKKEKAKSALLLKQKLAKNDLMIRPDLVVPLDKVRSVERFIETKIREGRTDYEIKKEMLDAGWDEHALDVIMYDVHIVDNNIDKLDRFVEVSLEKGKTLDDVKKTLLHVGWREDVVDLILDDFK